MNFFDWSFCLADPAAPARRLARDAGHRPRRFAIAVVLGLFLALGRRSRQRWLAWPVTGLIEFIRSTPLLIQVYFLFYVLPNYGLHLSALQAASSALRCTMPVTPPRYIAPASMPCRGRNGKR